MRLAKAPWKLKDVLLVHVLRLVVGLALVRLIYPVLVNTTPVIVEITDRIVVVLLVLLAIRKYKGKLGEMGVSGEHLLKNMGYGLMAGVLLLGVSLFSERLYTTVLLLTPTQHPLLLQVERAFSWRDLIIPLLLAGVAAPIAEEFLYRMFTFLPLKERWGLWGGALASAAIFALMHFNVYWLPEMLVVGFGLAILYYKTGSLISSIIAHAFINVSKILLLFLGVQLT